MTASIRLQVLSKWPIPGRVNTRLTPAISPQLAAELQWVWLRRACKLARQFDPAAELWLDQYPDLSKPFGEVFIQPQGDLGARMCWAAKSALQKGMNSLIIGSDCPALDGPYLAAAQQALLQHEVVLGPASDGGYALIGLSSPVFTIFEAIPWSTDQVLAMTVDKLAEQGVSYALLDTVTDIDTPDDLRHFLAQPQASEMLGDEFHRRLSEALVLSGQPA